MGHIVNHNKERGPVPSITATVKHLYQYTTFFTRHPKTIAVAIAISIFIGETLGERVSKSGARIGAWIVVVAIVPASTDRLMPIAIEVDLFTGVTDSIAIGICLFWVRY